MSALRNRFGVQFRKQGPTITRWVRADFIFRNKSVFAQPPKADLGLGLGAVGWALGVAFPLSSLLTSSVGCSEGLEDSQRQCRGLLGPSLQWLKAVTWDWYQETFRCLVSLEILEE